MPQIQGQDLEAIASEMRGWIIEMLTEAKSGHPGGSLSAIDIITALWFAEMRGIPSGPNLDASQKQSDERDRFVLSKGHGVPALYAVLAKKGFIPREELKQLRRTGSRLQGHPDRVRMPIVEASTGSLGQGLSVAQGLALSFQLDRKPWRVYCLLGDGEIQEGQVWEAAISAPKFGLSNLCAIIDANGGQIDGTIDEVMPIEPLAEKWRAFGWEVIELDGHDIPKIVTTLADLRARAERDGGKGKPSLIIARTIKGKGVSFMEHKIEWHGRAPKPDEAKAALAEILKRGT